MPSSSHPPSTRARLDAAGLGALVDVVAATAADSPPCIFGVEPVDDDGFELRLKPCESPADELVGWTAPPTWEAVGVSTSGRVHRWGDAHHTSMSAAIVHAVTRSGSSVTVATPIGAGAAEPPHRIESDEPVIGLTSDACRRALDLPCVPPTDDPVEAAARLWLDAIVSAAMRVPGLDASACWRLHPAVGLVDPASGASLAQQCIESLDRIDWALLRSLAVSGSLPRCVEPDVAAWCDDGSFSRLLMIGLPDPDAQLDALEQLVSRQVMRQIVASLRDACP